MANRTLSDFELGEWLDGGQMAAAKHYDARAEVLIDALEPSDIRSPHVQDPPA